MPTTLRVPYSEKDQAKALGARWNPSTRTWYVPDGLSLTPFRRWVPDTPNQEPAERSGEAAEPGWITLARCLGRGPLVFLYQQRCWRCAKDGLAVGLLFPFDDSDDGAIRQAEAIWNQGIDPDDEDAEYIGLTDHMGIVCGAGTAGLITGGSVAHPLVLRQVQDFSRGVPLKVAVFKERYSKRVQDRYMSQGCPHCDALWGNFYQWEVTPECLERIAAEDHGHDGLFVFQLRVPGVG